MAHRNQLMAGLALIALGALLFVGELLSISVWRLLLPLILIGLGIWVLMRPRSLGRDHRVTQRILGEVDRSGPWSVAEEEILSFIGDIDLDLSQAEIPLGETRIRAVGLVQDVTVRVPQDLGLCIEASGVFGEVQLFGDKSEAFFAPISLTSPNYATADRRLRLQVDGIVAEVKVERA